MSKPNQKNTVRRNGAAKTVRSKTSAPLTLAAMGILRRPAGNEHYKVLTFTKPDGTPGEALLPISEQAKGETYVFRILGGAQFNVPMDRIKRKALSDIIDGPLPNRRLEILDNVGWNSISVVGKDRVFCTPQRVYGAAKAKARLDLRQLGASHHFGISGTLKDWKQHVAMPAQGNRIAVFCLALAFVGPLLRLCEVNSFGVQVVGQTSRGKTIVAIVCGSVWGGGGDRGFAQSWLTTANALDQTALAHNDTFLVLDETLLAEDGERKSSGGLILKAAYRLVNGTEKARQTDASAPRDWRIAFLSTSETSLVEMAKEAKVPLHHGQQVRLIDIAADGGKGMGVFEDLHGAVNAETFARQLEASAKTYYGSASREFLKKLVAAEAMDRTGLQDWLKKRMAFYRQRTDKLYGSSGPLRRISGHYSEIYAAGCLACRYGVLPYKFKEIFDAVVWCHEQAMLDQLKDLANTARNPVAEVASYIRDNQDRFIDIDQKRKLTKLEWEAAAGGMKRNRDGEVEYLFSTSTFNTNVCGNLRPKDVVTELRLCDFMEHKKDDKSGIHHSFPMPLGRVRAITVHSRILEEQVMT